MVTWAESLARLIRQTANSQAATGAYILIAADSLERDGPRPELFEDLRNVLNAQIQLLKALREELTRPP